MTSPRRLAADLVRLARREQVGFLAAAIAYYALLSVVPAVLLLIVIATAIGGPVLAEQLQATLGSYLSTSGRSVIAEAVTNANGRAGAGVVGLVGLLWSALGVIRGIDTAFARIYATDRAKGLPARVRDTVLAGIGISVGIGTMLAIGTVLAAVPVTVLTGFAGTVLLTAGLFGPFLVVYTVLPAVPQSIRMALPGAVFVTVGWVTLQGVFQLYLAWAPRFELYGLIGGILLLVTWFYVAAVLVLLGASLNVVAADTRADRQRQGPPPQQ